jgi:hypothetical protein
MVVFMLVLIFFAILFAAQMRHLLLGVLMLGGSAFMFIVSPTLAYMVLGAVALICVASGVTVVDTAEH